MSYCLEEVFEMACQIERNGQAYYRKAAEATDSDPARQVLTELAEWEQRHEKVFLEMLEATPQEQRTEYADPQDEAELYLRAMVSRKVFDPADTSAIDRIAEASLTEVLRTAIGMEKESIAFYTGVKQAVPSDSQERVDAIIAEEMRHVRILTDLLPG